MGEAFGKGLLKAAGVVGEELDLKEKLGGDRPTAVAAVAQLMRGLTSLSISGNELSDESKQAIGAALHSSMRLFACNQVKLQADATSLDLCRKGLGPGDAALIGGALRSFMGSVTNLNLQSNPLKDEGVKAICEAIQSNKRTKLSFLNVVNTDIGSVGAKSVGALAAVLPSMTQVLVGYNNLGDEGVTALCNMVRKSTVSQVQELGLEDTRIGPDGAKAVAALCAVAGSLTSIDLSSNNLTGVGTETDYVKASEVQGSSFNVGDEVTYKGQKMIVSKGKDSDGDIKMKTVADLSGITALADALRASLTSPHMSGNISYSDREQGPAFAASLTLLSISGNKLSDESKQTIGAALQCSMRMFVCDQLTLQADATSLDLRRKGLGAGDAALIGGALRSFMGSVTVMDMRYNRLGTESATMLANVAKAKGISLCGITPEQIEADFTPQKNSGERMGPADAILLTADLSVRAVTSVSTAYNMIEGNGAQQLAWTVLAKPSLEIFSGIPLKELRADSLTTLDLSTKGLGVPEAIVLAGILQSVSSSVASLSLDNNELGDEGATVIARALKESKVSKLASLDLSGKGYGDRLIGKASAKELAEYLLVSDSITSLSTTYSDMSGEEAQQLAWAVLAKPTLEIFSGIPLKELRSESLTKLDLEGKGLGVPEAMVLADVLRSVCTSVTEVNLDGYPLPIKQLKGTEPTESIDLSSRHLGFVSAIVIASLIEGNAVLTTLDLSLNNLNAEAGKALAEALKSGCPALTGLDLAFNSLGPQGGAAIASALRGNAVLIHLSIGSNKLGAGSGAAIASALPVNKMLKSIDLSDNDLGPNGCTAIANTLSLSTLTDLNIASNNIGGFWSQVKQRDLHTEEWVTEMAEALRVSQVLSSVDLRNNVLSQEAYSVIKNAAGSLLELKLEQSNLLCGGKHLSGSD